MSGESHLESILSRLAASKECELGLLAQLDSLLGSAALPPHVARVVTQGREVLDEDAVRWLATPHWSLDHQMPLQVAQSAEGAARVEDLLTRIAAGMPV